MRKLIDLDTAIDAVIKESNADGAYGYMDTESIVDLLNDLPSVQPEQQWIPVGERLPDEYGEYLVTKHTIGWNCEEYVSNDIAYFDNDGFHKADMVIAYMPLPEPYKTKENEL